MCRFIFRFFATPKVRASWWVCEAMRISDFGCFREDFGNGTFQVRWDDPDGWPDLSNCEEEDLRRIRLSYKPGQGT